MVKQFNSILELYINRIRSIFQSNYKCLEFEFDLDIALNTRFDV